MTELATPSASRRQQLTRTRRLFPSTQRLLARSSRRAVEATLKLATSCPDWLVRRHSGAVRTLPTIVTFVSNTAFLLSASDAPEDAPPGRSRAIGERRALWTAGGLG